MTNAMKEQVFSLPELIENQYEDLEPKTRKVCTTPEIFSFKKIIITGCGDSLAAGMATKHLFEEFADIPVEVVNAIDLARSYKTKFNSDSPNNPLVIAISHSGAVARVAEAAERMKKNGAYVLAITSNEDSLLGQASTKHLVVDIPKFKSSPGVRSYAVSLVALYLLAIRFGEVKGTLTQDIAKKYRKDLEKQAALLNDILPKVDQEIQKVAEQWKDFDAFDFIGSGLDYGSVFFGHAKVFEAFGKYAMHVNTEEFLHLNFFMRNSTKIGTVLFVSKNNPDLSRALEVEGYLGELLRPTLIITDLEFKDYSGKAHVIHLPTSDYSALLHIAPLALLAAQITELIGEEYGRGNKDQWTFSQGAKAVRNSKIEIL